jgi:ParB family chromosome partitioning protein
MLWRLKAVEIREIPVGLLDVGEHEQRFDYADDQMDELVASIRAGGIEEPLIVRPVGDRFVVINGHRRREAALRIGLATVPCQVKSVDISLARRTAFVTNLFRKDPTPVELAVAIGKAVGDGEASVDELAKGLGRSVEWVKRQLALLEWPEDVLQVVHAGQLSVAAAANLARVTDAETRRFYVENAVLNGATARTTAAWLQAFEAAVPPQVAVETPAVAGPPAAPPLMPQAPCLCCGEVRRTDELSHVPLCAPCIQRVRRGLGGGS